MKTILASLIVGICPLVSTGAEPSKRFDQPVVPPRAVQVMVHRGMMRQAPENTRPAIERAIDDGMEWVEVDVRLTKDRRHVLFHDGELDGKSTGHGKVKDHTLAELQALDAGSWFAPRFANQRILSLPECLELTKGKINLYLDCKDVDPELLVREVRAAGGERRVIVYDSVDKLRRVRELSAGTIAIMPKWRPEFGLDRWLDDLKPAVVEIDADHSTPEICRALHARGVGVQAQVLGRWDEPTTWDKVIADGVDYLQTDLPEELIAHQVLRSVPRRPVQMALHRGAARYAPENTLASLAKAARLGADFVEFDVRTTRDGKFYLLHDANLDRTTGGHGAIRLAESAAVEALSAGAWFGKPFASLHPPSLDEFLAAFPPEVSLYFDAKDIPPEALARALANHGLAERTVVYQSPLYLEKLREIDPKIRALPPAASRANVDTYAARLKPYAVDVPWKILSREFIAHCHSRNIKVFSDAHGEVDVAGYRRAIDWGIDLIQTDFPLRLLRAIELRAVELPRNIREKQEKPAN
jgi:glycerophosphoryl diester phosphodiesterase